MSLVPTAEAAVGEFSADFYPAIPLNLRAKLPPMPNGLQIEGYVAMRLDAGGLKVRFCWQLANGVDPDGESASWIEFNEAQLGQLCRALARVEERFPTE
jgi:hypothetical protein